jgi:hypothetical protein
LSGSPSDCHFYSVFFHYLSPDVNCGMKIPVWECCGK